MKLASADVYARVNSEVVFRRAFLKSKSRDDINMETVMSHPITVIPTSLFHDDGLMRKNKKSELCHKLK